MRIFFGHSAVLEFAAESFEVRVTQNTYNPDIDGGFNSHYRMAIIASETILPD